MRSQNKRSMIGWIFICCWMTYLTAYLCRVNFSSAMHAITAQKGLSAELLGIVGAVFYGVYACGQLINGYIGDRVRADRFILVALLGTMACNLRMAQAHTLGAMIFLWGLNGVFQSMFWSTIIRVLAQNIPEHRRAAISSGISLAMPVAYIVSWGLLGQCLDGAKVQWYFLLPAFICVPLIGAWLILSGKLSFESSVRENKRGILETVRFLGGERLIWVVPACILHGLIKEGVAYWTPMLIAGMDGIAGWSPFLLASILPAANLVGILLSRVLLKRGGKNPYPILIALLCSIVLACVLLLLRSHGLFLVGMMAVISGLCYAGNTILLGFIPMGYTQKNMVASIIGVFDFASYAGAAVSTYVLGKVLGDVGFGPLPWIWLGAAAAASVLICIVNRKRKKQSAEVA